MCNKGRGREEDRGEPGAVAPEPNRALGRYVAIWTTNPEEKWVDRPINQRKSGGDQCNVRFPSHM
jgi:hypothetical protein